MEPLRTTKAVLAIAVLTGTLLLAPAASAARPAECGDADQSAGLGQTAEVELWTQDCIGARATIHFLTCPPRDPCTIGVWHEKPDPNTGPLPVNIKD